jgi:dolichyl-phosphate beta-glucosyltransferase
MDWLTRYERSSEVLIVDDGSQDGGETARVAAENGCRFIELPRNRGKGAAVRAGMRAARGRFRVFTDADLPFEFEAIAAFHRYLDFKEFQIVVGDRSLPQSSYHEAISPWRRLGSRVFTLVVGRFVTTGLFDTQCGLKGFRAEVAEDLFGVARIDGFAFDVELLYLALKRNYDIKRLPVSFRGDDGSSSVSLLRHGPQMVGDLLRIKLNQVLGRYRSKGGGS